MFAKITAIGRLTKDPEVKTINTSNGEQSVADFTVACDIGFGQNKKTEFIDCVAWRGTAETIGKYCQKGQLVYIEATPKTDKYETEKEKVKFNVSKTRYVIDDIRFLSKGKGADGAEGPTAGDEDAPF